MEYGSGVKSDDMSIHINLLKKIWEHFKSKNEDKA